MSYMETKLAQGFHWEILDQGYGRTDSAQPQCWPKVIGALELYHASPIPQGSHAP